MQVQPGFEEVVREQWRKIYNLAFRLSGNSEEAKDIVQETFMRAFEHYTGFEGRSAVYTYLYRIACNVWKNKIRRQARPRIFSFSSARLTGKEIDPADPAVSPARSLEQSEKREILQQGLNRLAPAERLMIVLRDIEERSYEEIAVILNCRLGTVKSRLARARERLRLELLPHMDRLK